MARKLKSSWILEHSSGLAPITENPAQFHIWSAISVVGSVLKNNVYIKYGTFKIFPNQYIVLVAPPGVGKGTAIHPAWSYAKENDLVHIISDRMTAPEIISRMAAGKPGHINLINGQHTVTKDSSATIFSTELATILGSSDWMLTFLCEAWDRTEFSYATKNSGSALVKGMCCSLIAACTTSFIRKMNKDVTAAIAGGFTARTIFVFADKPSKILPWPKSLDSTPAGVVLKNNLTEDLKQISTLNGEMSFTDEAVALFSKFHKEKTPLDDDSEVILHFKSRMHIHVLKCAMIFSCSRNDALVIEKEDMLNAITCLKGILANLNKTFRGVGDSDIAEATALVQGVIEKKGYTTRNEILSLVHRQVSPENLTRILALLESIGFIRGKNHGGGQYVYEHITKP